MWDHARQMAEQTPSATDPMQFEGVPGWELVAAGLADLSARRVTIEAELVRSASRRLEALGVRGVPPNEQPSISQLYELVAADVGPARAHGRYNSLRRRLASFLRAAHARPS